MPQVRSFVTQGIDHIALNVRDVHKSAEWYRDVLGFERRYADVWGDRPIVVGAGGTSLALFQVDDQNAAGPDTSPDRVMLRHIAFRVDAMNFQRAQDDLRRRGIAFEFQDHTISRSIYFADPDGYELEITTYDVGSDLPV